MAIELRDLTFAYGPDQLPAFQNVSLSIPEGSRCLVVGANGAGKSTLLRLVAGMHMVPSAAVLVHGHSAFHDTLFSNNNVAFLGDAWSRTMPFVGPGLPYSAHVTVWQMVNNMVGHDPARRDHMIRLLDIDPNWVMNEVSEGQRKRVMILLKLLRPYKVLLLDEITTHLDVIARQDFLAFLKQEAEERGATILYATHIFDGLEEWTTHLLHLCGGRVQRYCPIEQVEELQSRISRGEPSPLMRTVEAWLRRERELEPPRPLCMRLNPPPQPHA